MSKNELVAKIEALNEWEAVIEEAKAEAEAIRDSIKSEMLERDTEEMNVGKYIVRWTSILSSRFDTTAFKKAHGELYKEYTKQERQPPLFHQRLRKSPLRERRPKHRAKSFYPNLSGEGKSIITCPLSKIKTGEKDMKELTSYSRVAGYLNKVFDLLNAEFFESALSRPTITIQSTPRAYGHFSLQEDTWISSSEARMR